MSECPTWFLLGATGAPELWARLPAVKQWRFLNRSAIRNQLGLSRTAYLNTLDPKGKRKISQRILAEIRATRPKVTQ